MSNQLMAHISNNEPANTVTLPNPQSPTTSDNSLSFSCPRPVFFHVFFAAKLLDRHSGTLTVSHQPRAPNGTPCVMECGQSVVIFPDFTTAWYIEYFEEDGDVVTYTAFNDLGNIYLRFIIKREWSSVTSYIFLFSQRSSHTLSSEMQKEDNEYDMIEVLEVENA
jgi:hypothetical protein